MRSILITLSLVLVGLVPAAAAIDPVCVSQAATCIRDSSFDEGGCEGESGFGYANRGIQIDSGSDHASISNSCNWYDDGAGYSDSGSGLGVGWYRYDESTGEYRAAGVSWYGYSWTGGEPYCVIAPYSQGNDPVSVPVDPIPCPAGEPGMILPALP